MRRPLTATNSAVRSGRRLSLRRGKGSRSVCSRNPLRHNDFFSGICLYPGNGRLTFPARGVDGPKGRVARRRLTPVQAIGTGGNVNKAELIDALATRLGDKKAANAALDAVLAEIQQAVTKGDKVAI